MNVDGSAREHTKTHNARLKQVELVLFTLCDESFVFCDVAAEISAQVPGPRLWYDVRLQGLYVHGLMDELGFYVSSTVFQSFRDDCTRSICRIGPVIGIGLHVRSTLVVSPTYEPQHYKALQSKQKHLCAQRRLRSTRASTQSDQSLRSAHNG